MSLLNRAQQYRDQRTQSVQHSVANAPPQQFHAPSTRGPEPAYQTHNPIQAPVQQYPQPQEQSFLSSVLGGKIGYIIFALIPAIIVGFLVWYFKPSIVVDEKTGEVQIEKVMMFAGIAAALGLAIKAFLF